LREEILRSFPLPSIGHWSFVGIENTSKQGVTFLLRLQTSGERQDKEWWSEKLWTTLANITIQIQTSSRGQILHSKNTEMRLILVFSWFSTSAGGESVGT